VIPSVINIMNSVNILPMELPREFIPSVISLVKNDFFALVNYFFLTIIPSVYTEGIYLSVKFIENLLTEIFPRYFRLYLSIF